MNNKGQVTIFIIVAIFIIISGFLIYSFKDKLNLFNNQNKDVVYQEVYNCIKEVGEEGVYTVLKRGGYLVQPNLSNEAGIPYYYYKNEIKIPKIDLIEKEISKFVEENILDCTKGISLEKYNLTFGTPKSTTVIEKEAVKINLIFPVSSNKNNNVVNYNNFNNIIIKSKVGLMHSSIQQIILNQLNGNICLSCIYDIVNKEKFKLDLEGDNNETKFVLIDENSKIKDLPLKWNFISRYE